MRILAVRARRGQVVLVDALHAQMMGYAAAAGWGALTLCSMVGWGRLVHRAVGLGTIRHWARSAAAGVAFSACLGGVFELLDVTSTWLVLGFLLAGAIIFGLSCVRSEVARGVGPSSPYGSARLAVPLLAIAGALLVLRVAGTVIVLQPPTGGMQLGSFNTFDDFQGYLVYPLKMLDLGSMGYDPFSLRRTATHSLGGNAFLQTFILAGLPVESVRLMDVAIGTIVIVGLLWDYMSRAHLSYVAATSVILVFLTIPPPLVNTSSVLIPVALFLSLFSFFAEDKAGTSRVQRAAFVGIHMAAIASLKTSLIPAALAFPGALGILRVWRASPTGRAKAAAEGLGWFLAAGVAVLPWLLASYRWTGVFVPMGLAPYGADPSRVAAFQAVTGWHTLLSHLRELPRRPYLYLMGLTGFVFLLRATRVPDRLWSLVAAAGIGTVAVTLAVAGSVNNIQRFMYAFLMPATLVTLVYAISTATAIRSPRWRVLAQLGLVLATLVFVQSTSRRAVHLYQYNYSTMVRALKGERLISTALSKKYRNLQQSVPQDAVLIEHTDFPFLFDFRRNTIYVDDLPGSASPAPGQPFFAGGEALADYLIDQGIRYVAYDYGTEARVPRSKALVALANDDRHPSARAVVRLIFDFHDNLNELGRTRERVFDDGATFAIDLRSPAHDPVTTERDESRK